MKHSDDLCFAQVFTLKQVSIAHNAQYRPVRQAGRPLYTDSPLPGMVIEFCRAGLNLSHRYPELLLEVGIEPLAYATQSPVVCLHHGLGAFRKSQIINNVCQRKETSSSRLEGNVSSELITFA